MSCNHECNCHLEIEASGFRSAAESQRLRNEEETARILALQTQYWELAIANEAMRKKRRPEIQPFVRLFGKSWIASCCDVLGVGDTPAKAVAAYHRAWHEGVSEPLPEDTQE